MILVMETALCLWKERVRSYQLKEVACSKLEKMTKRWRILLSKPEEHMDTRSPRVSMTSMVKKRNSALRSISMKKAWDKRRA